MHNAKRSALFSCALSCFTLAAVGCGEQADSLHDRASLLDAPVALENKLVFVETTNHRAFLLDAVGNHPSASALRVELPFAPSHAERRNEADEALVLCDGRRSSRETAAEPAALAVVQANGKLRSYELGTTPFDTIVQSDDGQYALLYRNSNAPGGRVLNNANEMAIVDLDKKPSDDDAVTSKTLTSFGHTPTGGVFSPMLRIAEEDRHLLVVLSQAEVTLIDLNHPKRRETIVQLGGSSNREVLPQQVLFSTTGDPTLYVRGASSDDIFVFRLEARDAMEDQNDFRPSINQLGGGVGPTDMALFGEEPIDEEPASPRLLVVANASAQAIVVDPSSSKAVAVPLPVAMKHVLLFKGVSPKDTVKRTRALLYSDDQSSVIFIDLEDIATRRGRNLETLDLGKVVTRAIPLLTDGKMLLLHAGSGVSVLDLVQRTVVPITSNVALSEAIYDEEHQRLWVAPEGDRIGTLKIDSGVTDELLLDAQVEQMVPLFTLGKLAVIHPSKVGYVTFLDAAEPSRESAQSVRGFLVANVIDRGAP